jgi:hypothetical protein
MGTEQEKWDSPEVLTEFLNWIRSGLTGKNVCSAVRPRELNEADGPQRWRRGLYVSPAQSDHPK